MVANVIGNAEPDLLIANSGSNNVWLLQGLGNGFFNDQSPIVLAGGYRPERTLRRAIHDGIRGQDLVTVNSGSNSLTVISGLGSASPLMQTISSGGVDPTAAFERVATGFGQDLVVANNGDGNISLFQPGENGLALSSVLISSGLPNPSGLALASFTGGNLEFFAVDRRRSIRFPAGISARRRGGDIGSLDQRGRGLGSAPTPNESSLALIGSLLTISLETTESSEGSTAEVASAGPGAGQSLVSDTALSG